MATIRNLKRVVWDSDAEQLKALNDDQYRADVDNTKNYEDIQVAGGSSYLVYVALLTQSGTNAPVATIIQNTLGGVPVWSYSGSGYYVLTLAGVFTVGKTICFMGAGQQTDSNYNFGDELQPDAVFLGAPANGDLLNTPIEIRVYP